MKDKLLKLLNAKQEQRQALNTSMIEAETKEERAAIGETLDALGNEIAELKTMLTEIDEPASSAASEDERSYVHTGGAEFRNGNPHASKNSDPCDTNEYRQAFMNFVARGKAIPAELRATTTTTDSAAAIPTTILNEIVSKLEVYGNIFSKVRKLNVQGGVAIPVLSLKPTATWITADTGTAEGSDQKIEAKTSVTFNYYGLECKVSQTLLTNITTIDAFQKLFVELAVEAIAKALDVAIISGTGTGQPTGVTVDTRVPAANVITLSPTEFKSWSGWKKKIFAAIGKAYRSGTFYMAQGTFDGYIDGMTDNNGQPIGRVNYGIDGEEIYRFGGKAVETTEDAVLKSYDSASTGDVVAVFFNPLDYVINSNMEMQVTKWTDHDTNEIKNKVLLIADGKLADPNGVIVIKKGAAS